MAWEQAQRYEIHMLHAQSLRERVSRQCSHSVLRSDSVSRLLFMDMDYGYAYAMGLCCFHVPAPRPPGRALRSVSLAAWLSPASIRSSALRPLRAPGAGGISPRAPARPGSTEMRENIVSAIYVLNSHHPRPKCSTDQTPLCSARPLLTRHHSYEDSVRPSSIAGHPARQPIPAQVPP